MKFAYLRDPLFLFCVAVYFFNWFVMKPTVEGGFVHNYLNDLITIPFWVPIMLAMQRLLRMRTDDRPPQWFEIIIPLILWSYLFEVVLPRDETWGEGMVADVQDVFYYALGGLIATLFWRFWYRDRGGDVGLEGEDV